MTVVVDASVVLQWLLQAPAGAARTVLDRHLDGRDPLAAPELLRYEVGNVLVTKTTLAPDVVEEAFSHLLDLDIDTYTLGVDEYRQSLRLAKQYRLTVYDASYVALALTLGIGMVTADRRLAVAVAPLRIVRHI